MKIQTMCDLRVEIAQYIRSNFSINDVIRDYLIFSGSYHSVYNSFVMIDDESYNVIYKQQLHGDLKYKNDIYYSEMFSNMVLNSTIPNFPINYHIAETDVYQEKFDTDLFEWINTNVSEQTFTRDLIEIIIQTSVTIFFMNKFVGVMHNDVKTENIIIKKKKMDLYYCIMDEDFESAEFYLSTQTFACVTDFDFVKLVSKTEEYCGFPNIRNIIKNIFSNPLCKHSFEEVCLFKNTLMKDHLALICSVLNSLNNIPPHKPLKTMAIVYNIMDLIMTPDQTPANYIFQLKEYLMTTALKTEPIENISYNACVMSL